MGASQTVRIEVVVGDARPDARVLVETTWMGEDRSLELRDDGALAGDQPADGVLVGELSGEAVRVLPVRVIVDGDERVEAGAWFEPLAADHDRLVYAIEWTTPPRARRVAAAVPPRAMTAADTAGTAAAIGWAGLVLAYVGWLVGKLR